MFIGRAAARDGHQTQGDYFSTYKKGKAKNN